MKAIHAIAVLLVCGAAHAQSAEDRAAAQALFDEGLRLHNEGNHAAACPKFEASLKRYDGLGTRGKLAECYEKSGRVASAWAAYREVAVLARKAGEATREQVASERAKQLEARLPYLVVEVPEAARVPGLRVERNGELVDAGAFGARVAVDPGKYRIVASAEGYTPWNGEVAIAESESQRVAIPALTKLPPEETAPSPVPAPSQNSSQPEPEAPLEQPAPSPLKTVGLVAAGVGVASLTVGAYFGLRANSEWNSAFDDGHCGSNNVCTAEGQDLTDSARSAAVLANIFVGAGVVLVGGGAALYFTAPSERPKTTARGLRVSPGVGAGGLGMSFSGRF
ncbi:MAG: hypothetical protein R3B13_21150 [Polyangiaceae bacterium]